MKWPATGDELREAGYQSLYPALCRGCGKSMVFFQTPNDKVMPLVRVISEDIWQPHFVDCVARDQFRKKKKA